MAGPPRSISAPISRGAPDPRKRTRALEGVGEFQIVEALGNRHPSHRARAQVSSDDYRPATQVSQELFGSASLDSIFSPPTSNFTSLICYRFYPARAFCLALSRPY
jgi:hypothetical protein